MHKYKNIEYLKIDNDTLYIFYNYLHLQLCNDVLMI